MTHMIHVPFDMRTFNRWAAGHGMARRGNFDAGYALHVLLSAMFGKSALQPFRLFGSKRRRQAALYGYADVDAETLRATATAAAPPDYLAVLDLMRMQSKTMPVAFEEGQRLGFDLRARPVQRSRRNLDVNAATPWPKSAEVDAYRLRRIAVAGENGSSSGGTPTREEVYREWVEKKFGGAARVEECRLAALSRDRVWRGDKAHSDGPDATLHGTLVVADETEFVKRLRRGVGRHRAYGYGMLLLRPCSGRGAATVAAGERSRRRRDPAAPRPRG